MTLKTSVGRFTAIVFALGVIYGTRPRCVVEAQPRWTILYGDRAHKAMAEQPAYEYNQQGEVSPHASEQLMTLHDKPEVTMLIVELAELLKRITDEKYRRLLGFSREVEIDDANNAYEVDEELPSGPSETLGNGEVGSRQRPLIPKRAHGKCGIFKICSPLRTKQN